MQEEERKEEGPRDFARVLRHIGDGQCLVDMSTELFELMKTLREEANTSDAAKGSLTLELNFKVEGNGVVGSSYTIKRKEPAKRRPNAIFWLTKGGNLSSTNPRQMELPAVREVEQPERQEREPDEQREQREV